VASFRTKLGASGLRRQRGDKKIDLLQRPTLRLLEDGAMVLRREMPFEERQGGESHFTGGEQLQDDRKAQTRSGRF
jgi:hypothetical protein